MKLQYYHIFFTIISCAWAHPQGLEGRAAPTIYRRPQTPGKVDPTSAAGGLVAITAAEPIITVYPWTPAPEPSATATNRDTTTGTASASASAYSTSSDDGEDDDADGGDGDVGDDEDDGGYD